ncbi:STAS domain-containing protein [Neobacillus piezotolerans]|uniref:STAS domain-containing protein n=1 Tax=Neobacillus piezotolerans TaxID=2259171 RepID=A0A3D8GT92_9BACI|nr:STAS domain-containing protein [Neobacillus piezotolerans]RDU37542.1 STAS domain-containing protein [Neobacillus piezotolerans]
MKDELRYIGEKIIANDRVIARSVTDILDKNDTFRLPSQEIPLERKVDFCAKLIIHLGEALTGKRESILPEIEEWGKKAADVAIRYTISLTDSLRSVSFFRTVVWDVFTDELEKKKFAAITMLDASKIIDPLLDRVSSVVGEEFEAHTNRLMDVAYTALEELSVPVVPIVEGVAVVPLVGSIDTRRARLIMDVALSESTRMNVRQIIFDISGVPVIDTMVADQLFQIFSALRLTGVEAIITGIRPEISQTIVSLGLNFNSVKTRATMRQALKDLGVQKIDKQASIEK